MDDSVYWTMLILGVLFGIMFAGRKNLPLSVFCLVLINVGWYGLYF